MTTTKTTQNTGNFNQPSMGVFNNLQPTIGSNLNQFMMNPLQSSFFQQQYNMANQQQQNMNQSINNAFLNNLNTGGGFYGNLPAFQASQLNANARQASANSSNTFNNLLLGANQLRFGATQAAGGYRPFQMGGTTTQRTGGTGSWLPQIAQAGLQAGLGMATGGRSSFFSGAGARPFGNSGPGMQDTSGGAFSEGGGSYGNPNMGMPDPFQSDMFGYNSSPNNPFMSM